MTQPEADTADATRAKGGTIAVDPALKGQPERPTGVLGDIAARRDAIRHAQVKEFWVPRWNAPRLKVVCHPIPHNDLKKVAQMQERVAKEKDSRKQARIEVDSNADLIIQSCIEIVAVLDDGTEAGMGPGGARTRFDHDLAIALGLPADVGARATCVPETGIFITDADLLAVARELGEWSGYREDSIDSELRGES